MRRANAASTVSPAIWPWRSFIGLQWSRSMSTSERATRWRTAKRNALAVDGGAVAACGVLDPPLAFDDADGGVVARHAVVDDLDAAALRPADHHLDLTDAVHLTDVQAREDDEIGTL